MSRLPLAAPDQWVKVSTGDPAAAAMANRHYSRRRPGKRVGGPWNSLALMTWDGSALWLSTYTTRPMDGLDALRCNIFRNEGDHRASDLIRAAMRLTEDEWLPKLAPADGWVTWVDAAEVESEVPGYCFLRAGWKRDRSYEPGRRRPTLIRFRSRYLVGEGKK